MKEYLRARMPRIKNFVEHPLEVQQEQFQKLIRNAQNTEWGKQHGYKSISSYNDFQNRFPVQDYETLKPWFEKIQRGEKNVLWNSPVNWFSKSSGTTSDKSKFIPLSDEAIEDCHVLSGKDLMAVYYNRFPQSNVFAGKSLIIGGSLTDNFSEGIRAGDLSAVLIHRMPEWLQFFREPSREIVTMKNWEEKIDAIAKRIVKENITSISGVPTWMLMILRKVLELSKKKTIAEVWGNLELFVHGGVDFAPYKIQFDEIIGRRINYLNTYNASEGFFSFQDSDDEGMLLHCGNGIFYEFIPLEEIESANPKTVWLGDVALNKNYAFVISTNGGLWRYKIGDTVQFTSLKPYRIKITGRTKHFINVFGEEVMVHNTDKALALTCAELNCTVKDYTVAPKFISANSSGAHEWAIEFEKYPADISVFTSLLDKNLQQLNSDYQAKREGSIALSELIVHSVNQNAFYNYLASKNKLGGQNKIPRLSNERKFLEEILQLSS